MARSVMRWSQTMAEAMLKLRAGYLRGDFDAYWKFHGARDHACLHPPGSWRPLQLIEER
jgi:hypothetical protein